VGEELHEKVNPESAADLFASRESGAGNQQLQWPPPPTERRLVYKNIGRPSWTTKIDC